MTKPLRAAIDIIIKSLPKAEHVLEIGSRQVDNQHGIINLRNFFKNVKYMGIDMLPGDGVDKVVNAEKMPFKKESFDVVLCLETFEHAEKPWLIAAEIQRVLSKKGVVIVSTPQNYPLHLHPLDYFRYTPYGLSSLFPELQDKLLFSISPPFNNEAKLNPQTVGLIGWKTINKRNKSKVMNNLIANKQYVSIHKPYRHRFIDGLMFFKRGIQELFYKLDIEFFDEK